MESNTALAHIEKLLRKQKCIESEIRLLKPHFECTEAEYELFYNILCKYSDWFDANFAKIRQLYSAASLQFPLHDHYRLVQEIVEHYKSIYESYLLSNGVLSVISCTDRCQQMEFRKQECLMKKVASLEPANCVSEEEIELYVALLEYLREKFRQNQLNIGIYMQECDYNSQVDLCSQFESMVQRIQAKLEGNISIINDVSSLIRL